MSIFKEGYFVVKTIKDSSIRIYPDACDYGAPTKKDDKLWLIAKQAIDMYGLPNTRVENKYATGSSVSIVIELIDEGAVSDERKTIAEAKELYSITFTSCKDGACKNFDGYLSIK